MERGKMNRILLSTTSRMLCLVCCIAVLTSAQGCERDSKHEKMSKAYALYNAWNASLEACWKAMSDPELLGEPGSVERETQFIALMRETRSEMEAIDPYKPLGVDPGLASAVSEQKKALLAWVDATIETIESGRMGVSAWLDSDEFEEMDERVTAATEKVESEFNRVLAECD